MKYYGDLNRGLSEKEKLLALNQQRNLDGWFDKIWEKIEFRGSQRQALYAGEAVVCHNETCSARYQLTATGDLQVLIVRTGETKCFTVDRLTGEGKVDFYVRQPFEYE